jgi:hypothetical protein
VAKPLRFYRLFGKPLSHIVALSHAHKPIDNKHTVFGLLVSFGSDSPACSISWLLVDRPLFCGLFPHISSISLPGYATHCQHMLRHPLFFSSKCGMLFLYPRGVVPRRSEYAVHFSPTMAPASVPMMSPSGCFRLFSLFLYPLIAHFLELDIHNIQCYYLTI